VAEEAAQRARGHQGHGGRARRRMCMEAAPGLVYDQPWQRRRRRHKGEGGSGTIGTCMYCFYFFHTKKKEWMIIEVITLLEYVNNF
jgi:hypothetical protein